MVKRLAEIDVSDLDEVAAIAEEVQRTGESKLLRKSGKDLALITPVPTRRRRKTGILTESDPLLGLIGIGRGKIPGGISEHKDQALLDAKRDRIEP